MAEVNPDVNPDERLIGARLGPYLVESIVGYGGMGAVYAAARVDDEFLQRVAIKLVRASAASPSAQQRFRQERQILARLSHPHIARLLDGGSSPEGVPYIVMEFIEGEPITAWCERKSLSVEQRLQVFLQVCEGVEAAHREHIIHRDLKPANIQVTRDGVAKLLDFGIAKFLDPDADDAAITITRFQAMTPDYAAPEQIRGGRATAVADVYSLGLVLYEILTGTKAMSEPTAPAALKAHLAGDLDNIVLRAIRKEPERRYQTVAALSEDIRRHLAGKPVTARPDTWVYRWTRFLRRNRVAVKAAAVSAACVACGLALAYWLSEPPRTPRALQIVQLTQGAPVDFNGRIVTDGRKLYFAETRGGGNFIAQVSVNGGTPSPVPVSALTNSSLFDISPDGANLLLGEAPEKASGEAVWVVPTTGGSARRVDNVSASFAAWSQNGRGIFFLQGPALFHSNIDGTDYRKLADVPDGSYEVRVAPAPLPEVLRLSLFKPDMRSSAIFEIAGGGTALHAIAKPQKSGTGWPDAVYSGDWIPSGRYYLLRSRRASVSSFWALRETSGWLRPSSSQPVKIYSTPLETRSFTSSRDGKRIFFAGAQKRSELVRFDQKLGQLLPFLPGIGAEYLSFSRDQREMAYTLSPQDTLWKSQADGSHAVQLTRPAAMHVFRPSLSPDGKLVAFVGSESGEPTRVFVIPSDGGTPEQISSEPYEGSPAWSPDGKSLMVTRRLPQGTSGIQGLFIIDWKTRKSAWLRGSEKCWFGAWSPDQRYILAMRDRGEIDLLDLHTMRWSPLVGSNGIAIPLWSHDSKYIYFQNFYAGDDQPIFRVRIRDKKVEQLMSSKQIPQSDVSSYSLTALGSGDAPIATVTRTNSDIYALDVDLP